MVLLVKFAECGVNWYTHPMVVFEDIQDIRDWLEPLNYGAFWDAVAFWNIYTGADRAHFDGLLASGVTDTDTVLNCLKAEVRLTLTERFGLEERCFEPPDAQYLHRVH